MNCFSKIYKTGTVLMILFPFVVFAQTGSQTCLSRGYTIETINGIFTDEAHAGDNKVALQKYFPKTYHNEPLTIDFLINQTHSVLDVTDTAIQKTFEGVDMWDTDFLKMLNDASTQVKTQKVLLVAHSQGNFYANNVYKVVTDAGDVPKKSIGVYGVASPASYVAGEGRHLTSSTDKVIAFLVENVLPGTIAPTNETIDYKWSDDPMGHDFAKVYLQYRPTEIVRDIKGSLDKLSVDPTRSENTPCINPPKELSTLVKIISPVVYATKSVFVAGVAGVTTTKNTAVGTAVGTYYVAVNTAVWTYGAAVATAVWTYNTTVATVNAVANTAVAAASTISAGVNSLMNDTGNLATSNSAAVILATQPQNSQTLPAVSTLNVNKPTVPVTPPVDQPAILAEVITPATISAPATVTEKPTVLASVSTTISIGHSEISAGSLGGAVVPAVEVVVTPPTEAIASTTVSYVDGVIPAAFASTTLSSATTTFTGTYNNSTTFDKIVFELKNISLDTATSSVTRTIATTTGENLPYNEEITLESEGGWQYWVRLEDSGNASSTPWSTVSYFSLATSTTATTTSTIATTVATSTANIIYQQTDDSAHSQSHTGDYLIQTYIHQAADPTWGIKKIKLRFNPIDDNNLSVSDCKWADISFPVHAGSWNGNQNNISAQFFGHQWTGVTVDADDTTKTCTYTANFGNLVSLNSGTDYDMVFSSGSWTAERMQIYGSPSDVVVGAFGYFTYQHSATPSLDANVADAFFEFATSTEQIVVQHITPLFPVNISVGTSSIAFSGTYRDVDGIFNVLRVQVEATSTTSSLSTNNTFSVPATLGGAVPFSKTIDLASTELMGVRWRVQAHNYTWWNYGYDTPWTGTTGFSDWQYFTFDPVATTTPPI